MSLSARTLWHTSPFATIRESAPLRAGLLRGSFYKRMDSLKSRHLSHQKSRNTLRIVSLNMLCDRQDPLLAQSYRWPARLPRISYYLKTVKPDLIATQELFPNQLQQLAHSLEPEFQLAYDPRVEGENNAIFYRPRRLQLQQLASLVLEPAAEPLIGRTSLLCQFKDLASRTSFYHFNTHLSFASMQVRYKQAQEMGRLLQPLLEGAAVLLTGDLNTFPCWPGSSLPFADGELILDLLRHAGLLRSDQYALYGHLGPTGSFTNSPPHKEPFEGFGTPGVLLDHLLVNRWIQPVSHAVEPALVDGLYLSDHLPILVDLMLGIPMLEPPYPVDQTLLPTD